MDVWKCSNFNMVIPKLKGVAVNFKCFRSSQVFVTGSTRSTLKGIEIDIFVSSMPGRFHHALLQTNVSPRAQDTPVQWNAQGE